MPRPARLILWIIVAFLAVFAVSCSSGRDSRQADHTGTPRDNSPHVLSPAAGAEPAFVCDTAFIDTGNSTEGYIMVKYTGSNPKVAIQLKGPDANTYTYLVSAPGSYEVFPLTAGNGSYEATVLESIPDAAKSSSYAQILSGTFEVVIADDLKPFLYPNQYVNFTADSMAVAKASDLASGCYSELEVVANVYNFVVDNISYDTTLADNVEFGYLPDLDKVMKTKTGICFDYASLMAAMLRSQNIPVKLEVGYSGEVYHAWISTYIKDIGWIDSVIQFDGKNWSLMDPTLAANNNDKKAVKNYVGDGSNYTIKYVY